MSTGEGVREACVSKEAKTLDARIDRFDTNRYQLRRRKVTGRIDPVVASILRYVRNGARSAVLVIES